MRSETRDRIVSLATIGVVAAALVRRPTEAAAPGPSPEVRDAAPDLAEPAEGLVGIAGVVGRRIKTQNVPLVAAGLAFYAFLALVPALIAAVLIFGLVADPADLERMIADLAEVLPDSARDLIEDLLSGIVSGSSTGLGIGLAVALAAVLWSASSGVNALVKAINAAFELQETRSFLRLRALSGMLTVGAIVLVAMMAFVGAALPVVVEAVGMGDAGRVVVTIGRWPTLLVFVAGAMAVLYRVAPNRPAPPGWMASAGALVAAIIWVAASGAFSFYVATFGTYNQTYGVLAGVIVLLLWFFLSGLSVLLGALVDAELERRRVGGAS
jgi:membrane protein